MNLIPNWKDVLTRAWSIQIAVAAATLSALEVGLPFFTDLIPQGLFAALSGLVASAAIFARLLDQSNLPAE